MQSPHFVVNDDTQGPEVEDVSDFYPINIPTTVTGAAPSDAIESLTSIYHDVMFSARRLAARRTCDCIHGDYGASRFVASFRAVLML
jgi:hypothetical protein